MNAITPIQPDAPEQMTQMEVENFLRTEIADSLSHIYSSSVASERQRNWDYYNGIMDDMPAPPKRSQVVEPTVSTYINMLLPGLMRVFTSSKILAKFKAPVGVDPTAADLASKYISTVVLRKDNDITSTFYRWMFDATLQKVGIAKAWWEIKQEPKEDTFAGLSDEQFAMLLQSRPNDQVVGHTEGSVMQTTELGTFQVRTHDVTLRTMVDKSKVCIKIVPPEEFVISRDATTLDDAVLVSHRSGVYVGDLVKQGLSVDDLKDVPTYNEFGPWSSRTPTNVIQQQRNTTPDPMLRKVTVHEGIVRLDADGTGLRRWYFKAAGGESKVKLIEFEPYDFQVVFADLCPNPLPHQFFGRCPADDLSGVQRVQTALTRQYLDALYLSNTPQREVVQDWIIKPDQLMNMAPGAPVLVKQPGAIREIKTSDVSQQALAGLEYFERVAEQRSGINRQSAGLDPDALQKQLATTALLAQAASTAKVEMIARIFADGGMTKLFRGLLNIVARYQQVERVVQFDTGPAKFDPRQWQGLVDADVEIDTGLGTGSRERDISMVSSILGLQEKIVTELGPNPIVTPKHVYNAAAKLVEAAGLPEPKSFFSDPGDWTPQPPPPTPDPNTVILADVEKAKVQAGAAEEAAKIESSERLKFEEIASRERIAYAQEETKRLLKGADIAADSQARDDDRKEHGFESLAASIDNLAQKVKSAKADADQGATLKGLTEAVAGIQQAVKTMSKPKVIRKNARGEKMVVVDE